MQVSVLYFPGCPNWQHAGQRLRAALAEVGHGGAAVEFVPVRTCAEAAGLDFRGSPTITVDGVDLFPDGGAIDELACRVYRTTHGLAGVPEVGDLVAALRARIIP